jgi:hypothetical protein
VRVLHTDLPAPVAGTRLERLERVRECLGRGRSGWWNCDAWLSIAFFQSSAYAVKSTMNVGRVPGGMK